MTEKRFEVKHDIPYGSNHYGIIDNVTGKKYGKSKYDSQQLCNEVNIIIGDNDKLKERNKRQYNQLKELWDLIEEENWEILIEMVNQMKEEDKRLQRIGA